MSGRVHACHGWRQGLLWHHLEKVPQGTFGLLGLITGPPDQGSVLLNLTLSEILALGPECATE